MYAAAKEQNSTDVSQAQDKGTLVWLIMYMCKTEAVNSTSSALRNNTDLASLKFNFTSFMRTERASLLTSESNLHLVVKECIVLQ